MSRQIGTDAMEGIRRLKAQNGPDLLVCGSASLTGVLLNVYRHVASPSAWLADRRNCVLADTEAYCALGRPGAASMQATTATRGFFNYIDRGTESSLRRNGKVFLRRDGDGSDSGLHGVVLSRQGADVVDARQLRDRPTLAGHGFELLERPLEDPKLDFYDHQQVLQRYYPECVRLVERHTGARAFAFDHNVRSVQGKKSQRRIAGGQQVQEPLHMVHGDYTLTSGPQRLRDLSRPPGGNDTLRTLLGAGESLISPELRDRALAEGGRFAIVNVWRNIAPEPVAMHPLAVCDNRSIDPADLVVFELHYADRIGENYFVKPAPGHRWYWYSGMTRDEALLIKQWDSAGTLARSNGRRGDDTDATAPTTFTLHSAFEDPATLPDAPDRQSIEVRCLLVYE